MSKKFAGGSGSDNSRYAGVVVLNIVLAVFVYFITYYACYSSWAIDFGVHITSAGQIAAGEFSAFFSHNQYPIWHAASALLQKIEHGSLQFAAFTATGLFNMGTFAAVSCYMNSRTTLNRYLASVAAFCVMLIGPVSTMSTIYWTPNTWHNPTAIAVRPFAVASFVIIVKMLDQFENQIRIRVTDIILLAILLLLSNLAKPSFAQIVIPGLGVYLICILICRRTKEAWKFFLQMVVAFLPSFLMTYAQYRWSFSGSASGAADEGGIVIAPFEHLNTSLGGRCWLLALFLLFPLFALLFNPKSAKRSDVRLMWAMLISAFIEMALLEETGSRKNDGNFTWGYILAEFFAFAVSLKVFLEYNREFFKGGNRKSAYGYFYIAVGWLFMAAHMFIGIRYYILFVLA